MPWTPKDAKRHDKKAASGKKSRQWSDVANSVLKRTGDEGLAVREANGVVKSGGGHMSSEHRAKMQSDMQGFKGESAEMSHKRPMRKILRRHQ